MAMEEGRKVRCSECSKMVPEEDVTWVDHNVGDMETPMDDFEYAAAVPLCRKCTNAEEASSRIPLALGIIGAILVALYVYVKLYSPYK